MDNKSQNVEERYWELLHWFDKHKTSSRVFYYLFQIITILFSALTPIVILAELDAPYNLLEAVLPAMAAIAASIQALFKFNETWVSRAEASERLKSEFIYYKSRIGPLYSENITQNQVVGNFLDRIEEINRLERSVWVSIQEKSRHEQEN
ncbi:MULTISPECIES: DUF4231 domain-containing protein [unclassified Vibrio]|uniref:DUF4231 domain-containing protein n=1 Tax=unclassified Vibrio TaxID=2614977 RepID=UPI001361A359|nr:MULTISPECIES: DUF4231 domain-containing protein [unclassified Vibrio]NAW56942.1 DUF4231 domain-containing protein [Vibrio sp. V36_P2S2PM302]NAX25563.1 DUF4231 domain-containing protein [Vibrio sp. V38_P2S17PM301]